MNVYHEHDPNAKNTHCWHFVYLHGEAENMMQKLMNENNWDWSPSDMCYVDQPMPDKPGEYPVTIYGRPAIAVIASPFPRNWLCGRVALVDDPTALAHARKPDDWR